MEYTHIDKLASAIHNDIVSGLRGYHHNESMSMELLKDEVIWERLQVIKEYLLKGILPLRDLMTTLSCIPVDCKAMCSCNGDGEKVAHFEIPQIINDYGQSAVEYIGSPDLLNPFLINISTISWKYYKYRRRGKNRPYVYIDTTPNENNMYDCYVYNAPLLKCVTVIAAFKDPRLFCGLPNNCSAIDSDNFTWVDNEVIKRLAAKKILYYRLLAMPLKPNDLTYTEG